MNFSAKSTKSFWFDSWLLWGDLASSCSCNITEIHAIWWLPFRIFNQTTSVELTCILSYNKVYTLTVCLRLINLLRFRSVDSNSYIINTDAEWRICKPVTPAVSASGNGLSPTRRLAITCTSRYKWHIVNWTLIQATMIFFQQHAFKMGFYKIIVNFFKSLCVECLLVFIFHNRNQLWSASFRLW